ncbi:MAG: DUF2141 domain-containing protein [Bacteroidota bacterium]
MMYLRIFSFVLFSFLFVQSVHTQSTYDLTVEVKGIETLEGNIMICLVSDKNNFLDGGCKRGKSIPANRSTVEVTFEQSAAGYYAITLFHDENSDQQLNTEGLFGMPSESYGFSNNPTLLFGPPSFDRCRFKLSEDQVIQVKLK